MNGFIDNVDDSRLLPFLWLKGEDEETLRRGVREVREMGCGAVCVESRTHPDFMGESWWRDLGIVLDECQKRNMKLWILDDEHFPSGYAAGAAANTPYQRMLLTEKHMDVIGPVEGGAFVVRDDETVFRPGEGIAAVVAARRMDETTRTEAATDIGGWKLGESVDMTGGVSDGLLYWDVPDGVWRVFVLTARYVTERTPPKCFTNPLLPDSARLMIESVYQPHYEHFKEHFGRTFMGFFSDEPALRAGRGYHAVLGEYPALPIPWRSDMIGILNEALGGQAARLLPGLWYDIGPDTPRVRYALMDTVSRLYGENYSMPLGDWCRAHGVMYIGHVIEQNNTHMRLGSGAGHYFRAVSGQDMAGIDIVLHEIRPEFSGLSHAWQSQDFEADDDFFRFMLAQMAVSSAHLDPKKRGRTMCEIFGAYGWQEDAAEMRYLANLMLSRGVNYFTPHAFTMQAFPDPDSPPHFDARMHPMLPYIKDVFSLLSRIGSLIDGGRHIARAAVLYSAEGEWANGSVDTMKTQTVVKALNQRQIECEIMPTDLLDRANFEILFIPRMRACPAKLLTSCQQLLRQGKRICFVDGFPEVLCEGSGDIRLLTRGMRLVPLSGVADAAAAYGKLPYRSMSHAPNVHLYPYEKDGEMLFLLFNEDMRESAQAVLRVDSAQNAYIYDPDRDECRALRTRTDADAPGQTVCIALEPAQMLILRFTDRVLNTSPEHKALKPLAPHKGSWRISLRAAGEDEFKFYTETDELFDLSAPGILPRFSGTVRYETEAFLPGRAAGLEITGCAYGVCVWIDGEPVGHRGWAPYLFRFAPREAGRHTLRVELSNTPVFMHRDRLSFFARVKPTGILGEVLWLQEEN